MESKSGVKKVWKILAIILLVLLVLENAMIIWGMSLVNQDTTNENKCIVNVCSDYSSYYYDINSKLCSCFENKEVKHQEYIT